MNSKQRRKYFRGYERMYEFVRQQYKKDLQSILDDFERYPKVAAMLKLQGRIEQCDVPFKDAIYGGVK